MQQNSYAGESSLGIDSCGNPLDFELEVEPLPPKTVVPVIYIPGIFGSRLESTAPDSDDNYLWDPDDVPSLVEHYAKGYSSGFIKRTWTDEEIENKAARINARGRVMDDYDDKKRRRMVRRLMRSPTVARLSGVMSCNRSVVSERAEEEYRRRKARGWYGPLSDYHQLLETINETEDDDFLFPAFAFGYDWRQDLRESARALVDWIKQVLSIPDYPDMGERGVHYAKIHQQVIIVTHSMGSILARYASEVLGASDKILGIIHMNQPTTGAPILYRRFITGTGPERRVPFTPARIGENVFSEVLGTSSYHLTRITSAMTGALQLLPTRDYDEQPGLRPSWLDLRGKILQRSVAQNTSIDFYLDDRVGLVSHKRYDPNGKPRPYTSDEFRQVWDSRQREGVSLTPLGGRDPESLRPGEIIVPPPLDSPYHLDNSRLRPNSSMSLERLRGAHKFWQDFESNITIAIGFHETLGLKRHSVTRVIRSSGLPTVTNVRLHLSDDYVLRCPYDLADDGDGTVPLSSQAALLGEDGTREAGPEITGGKPVHAKIVEHPEAIGQALDAIQGEYGLVQQLREQRQTVASS